MYPKVKHQIIKLDGLSQLLNSALVTGGNLSGRRIVAKVPTCPRHRPNQEGNVDGPHHIPRLMPFKRQFGKLKADLFFMILNDTRTSWDDPQSAQWVDRHSNTNRYWLVAKDQKNCDIVHFQRPCRKNGPRIILWIHPGALIFHSFGCVIPTGRCGTIPPSPSNFSTKSYFFIRCRRGTPVMTNYLYKIGRNFLEPKTQLDEIHAKL